MSEKSEIHHDVAAALFEDLVEAQTYRLRLGFFNRVRGYVQSIQDFKQYSLEDVASILEISEAQANGLMAGKISMFTLDELIKLSTNVRLLHGNENEPSLIVKVDFDYSNEL